MTGIDIKIARIRVGVRQHHLAGALRISQTALSQIENGHKPVSQVRLDEIAQAIRDLSLRPMPEAIDGRPI
ncbi:MAG: Helix-turn-helix domain [Thermomicrobiales bacterium]|jgi:transcriptional regulator with XRE-family HTH domain|nr:Helix-turn-helix domain [Thermomicrobiales bacterium]